MNNGIIEYLVSKCHMVYTDGKGDIAYESHNLDTSCGVNIEGVDIDSCVLNIDRKLKRQYGESRRLKSWHRIDIGVTKIKTSYKGGADWNDIDYQIIVSTAKPKDMIIEPWKPIDKRIEHRQLPWGRATMCTFLLSTMKLVTGGFGKPPSDHPNANTYTQNSILRVTDGK